MLPNALRFIARGLAAASVTFGLAVGLFVVLGLVVLVAPAFAQGVVLTAPQPVSVPWGDWLSAILSSFREILSTVIMGAIIGGIAKFAPQVAGVIQAARVEQLLARAVDYGIVATSGALKGKQVDVKVANKVLAEALNYAVASAPKLAAKIDETIRPKLIARIAAAGLVPADSTVLGPPSAAIIVPAKSDA